MAQKGRACAGAPSRTRSESSLRTQATPAVVPQPTYRPGERSRVAAIHPAYLQQGRDQPSLDARPLPS